MRGSVAIAGAAAGVAALLTVSWFLLGDRQPQATGPGTAEPSAAPLTELSWPPEPSGYPDASRPPRPYPAVPPGQVEIDQEGRQLTLRTTGSQLLVPVVDADCAYEEVRLLGEHDDRVEVEIRMRVRPAAGGSTPQANQACGFLSYGNGPYAAVDLRAPLGSRTVVVLHRP